MKRPEVPQPEIGPEVRLGAAHVKASQKRILRQEAYREIGRQSAPRDRK